MKRLFCILAMVGLPSLLAGCGDNGSPQTTTVEFSQPQATDTAKSGEPSNGIRVRFITADDRGHRQAQAEVQRQMEAFINGGQYEIVRVVTTRCNGVEPHLLGAEVYYRAKSGEPSHEYHNGIRVRFITADDRRHHWQAQAEVQRQMEAFINGGQYEIVRVVTTHCNGVEPHLLGAEVYYRFRE